MNKLEDLKKDSVFYYFNEVSKIPRESGNEKEISDYLKKFAEDRGLYVRQDDFNNIVIKKPASKGYENAPAVIIQGHMDMVCEKNEGTVHDFKSDPIELVVDGDKLTANGTTLGADNGIAVAYALALLDSDDTLHPALEIVVTTDEEVGLTGAIEMDSSDLEGKYFINLDSEEEGELVVSCAGGLRALLTLPLQYDAYELGKDNVVQLSIKGLKGGHSGMEIDKCRANAIAMTGRILSYLEDSISFKLLNLSGGMKDNVIPREAFISIVVSDNEMDSFKHSLSEIIEVIKNEYKTSDPDIVISYLIDNNTKIDSIISESTKKDIEFLLMTMPEGVQSMSAEISGLVESSLNLGNLYISNGELIFEFATRSSVRSRKHLMTKKLILLADKCGAKCIETRKYPEWPLKKDSKLLEVCVNSYKKLYGKTPIIKGIHAGLEPGVFLEKLPHLDAISFGPDTFDVHSPDEWISIESTKRTYSYLLDILKSIK